MISISNAALVALLAVSHMNISITHAHAASASAVTSSESEGTIRNENENSNLVSIDIPNDKDDGNQSIESPFREYTLTDTTFEFNPRHAAWLQKHSLNDWNANHQQQQQQQQSNFKSKISNPNSNKIDNNSDNNKIDKIRKEEEIVEAHLRGISYSQQQFDEVEKELEEYARSSSLTRMNSNGLSLFTPLKNQFVNHCAEYLLSDLVLEDELISQVDSTNFLINYCKQVNVCEDEYTTSFHALDFKIQLAFTRFNCPLRQQAPLVSEQECLDELDAQGEEFGKVVTDPNNVVLRQEVVDYCVFLWIFGEDFHGGTQSPTQGPTKEPTVSPSVAPTGGPSVSPTKSPTVSPTDLPSVVPTASPTSSPTKLPSASPTSSPSAYPTSSPTASPTKLPSAPPTSSPSAGPTAIPTASPTKLPSASPTASPSASPTEYPSASPSVSPTKNPTQTPTAPPTEVPSPSPTKSPTKLPSVSPTLSQMPSASPTPGPTFIGSFHPSVSVKPSTSPTSTPSASPTSTPTSSPSVSPTSHPSVSPTSTPTSSPSVSPTSTPTSSPSASPTSHPSVSPTSSPSASPTSEPTATPSVSPTASPSSHPSAGPTPSPSASPTQNPSASPTSVPSVRPTSSPTDVPSASPTSSPTAEPSFTPSVSDAPSSKPSSHPTFLGTWHPSSSQAPSTVPSVSPTATPTNSPSNAPSTGPTSTPSVSPTDKPTSSPTNGPSDSPTSEPTSLPSTVPTKAPSPSPTYIPGHSHRPSGAPSESPTASPTTSPAPSTSIAPSASPTSVRMFKVSFTYILGFEDTEINSRSLDDANRNVDIMDSVRGGLYKVLAFNKILRKRNLRTSATTNMRDLIGFRSDAPEMDNIYHKNVEDEDECPEAFTDSLSCVRIVTEVAVFADPNTYDDASVATEVQEPISAAMSDNFFIDSTGRGEVKEAKYLGGGTVLSGDEVVPAENNRGILTGPGIAGVAVGALFMMFIIGLFAFTRSRAEDDRDDENPELQSNAESYADIDGDMETPRGGGKVNVRSIGESDAYESSSISRAAQFDPETGDVIPPAVSLVSASSSNYDDSDEEGELLIGRLDAAVSAGDWAAVAAIAGDLSTADEASTMSSLHSTKFDNITDRNGLSEEDAKRAVKIDDLITAGDWNAVGATAAAFDSDGSASGSRRSGDIEPRSIGEGGKKKSILDFIAGPWQSSAASKAIVEDGAEADVESLKLDGSKLSLLVFPFQRTNRTTAFISPHSFSMFHQNRPGRGVRWNLILI